MTEIHVRIALAEPEIQAARALCEEWLDWHWKNYPPDWPVGADHPMNPEKFRAILSNLPELHGRPRGAIFVAYANGKPAGCVMYSEAGPRVAEFKRMFVSVTGRGYGLGRKLLESMFKQMAADGYERVFFSSARFLTHAYAMYRNAGFIDMPHPKDFPEAWRDKVYFMQRSLV